MKKIYQRIISKSNIIVFLFTLVFCSISYADIGTYTYDNLDRLTSLEYDNGIIINYSYDGAGNRVTLSTFVPTVEITVDTSPSGLTINVDGSDYTSPQIFTWEINSKHKVNVPSPIYEGTDIKYIFDEWSDGGAQSHTVRTPLFNSTYTAIFQTQNLLTTTVTPANGGNITFNPDGLLTPCYSSDICYWYDSGTSVTLTALASTGSTFTGWSGGGCSGTGTCVVNMDAAKSVTAVFTINTYTLSVSKSGTGSGTVASSPAGIDCGADCSESYDYNTVVTLTATPDTGSTFTEWSGACTGIDTCVVTMDTIKSVTATFTSTVSNNLYLAWTDNTYSNYEILFKKSTDGGTTWTAIKRLTNNIGTSNSPSIAADGANIYLIWSDTTYGNSEILFRSSTDGGNTWSTIKRLTNNGGLSIFPDITINGTNIYAAWTDDTYGNSEILFKKSTDGGTTWSAIQRLTNNIGISTSPSITTDGVNIYLAWQDTTYGNNEILFRKSTDGGNTWTAIKRLTNNIGWSTTPVIKANGGSIYLTWTDDTYGNNEILFRKSTDGGNTWSAIKRLTNNTGFSGYQTIKTDGANIYLTWQDTTLGNTEILFRKSTDSGTTWSAIKRITNNIGLSQYPSISINLSNVYISWQDTTFGNSEILFRKSIDGGNTWTAVQRLTNNIGLSETPVMP